MAEETPAVETWRTIVDRLRGDAEKLNEQYVAGKEALVAIELARAVNRSVWSFINSTEALYVERIYDMAAILRAVSESTGATFGETLVNLAEVKGITVHGAGVVRWARAAGVDVEKFKTETWKGDLGKGDQDE